jgi:hypothetical protein
VAKIVSKPYNNREIVISSGVVFVSIGLQRGVVLARIFCDWLIDFL